MKKPKKNEKWLHAKRTKKAAKRKKIRAEKLRNYRKSQEKFNKMTEEELKEYLGDDFEEDSSID